MSIIDTVTELILSNQSDSFQTVVIEYEVSDFQEVKQLTDIISQQFSIKKFDETKYDKHVGFQIVHVYATRHLTIVIEFYWDDRISKELQKKIKEIHKSISALENFQLCVKENNANENM